ncbi:MAG: AtpZ/AtpI family protein [Flavobacteriaceae bacterium]|nr:AtpZ/AtpI family protein [Flavobacteriaceae bacterium]
MNKQSDKPINKYIYFSSVVFQMAITITIAAFAGQWLDEKFPNNYSLFTVILSLLAVFGTLYLVIKRVILMSKEDEKRD